MKKLKVGNRVVILPSIMEETKKSIYPRFYINLIGKTFIISEFQLSKGGKKKIYLHKCGKYNFKEKYIKKVKPINISPSKYRVGNKVIVLPSLKESIKARGWHKDMLTIIDKTFTLKFFDKDKDSGVLELNFEGTPFFLYEEDVKKI